MTLFAPTHEVVLGGRKFLVQLVDDVVYTREDWEQQRAGDWECVDGMWLYQGSVLAGEGRELTFCAAITENSNSTGIVYAVGETEALALHHARQRFDPAKDDGELVAVPCSSAAYAYVSEYGGEPCRELVVCDRPPLHIDGSTGREARQRTGVWLRSEEERCAGPGTNGRPCGRKVRARGFCSGHLAQEAAHPGEALRPIRRRPAEALVVVGLRVPAAVREAVQADPAGARAALQQWAGHLGSSALQRAR